MSGQWPPRKVRPRMWYGNNANSNYSMGAGYRPRFPRHNNSGNYTPRIRAHPPPMTRLDHRPMYPNPPPPNGFNSAVPPPGRHNDQAVPSFQPPLPPAEVVPPPPPEDESGFGIVQQQVSYVSFQYGYSAPQWDSSSMLPNPRFPFRMPGRYQSNGIRRTFGQPRTRASRKRPYEGGREEVEGPSLPRKKSMATSYPTKEWNKHDAEMALACEVEFAKKDADSVMIKFPEPDITSAMVLDVNPAFEKVHFIVPSNARYCFAQLKEGTDKEKVIKMVNETDFLGRGNLQCYIKPERVHPASDDCVELVDPYTLYLGNMPMNIISSMLKEKFPTSQRIDIGFAQKMKQTRYAFIRFQTVEDAIEAYKSSRNLSFDSRNLVVRFRRNKTPFATTEGAVKLSKKKRKAAKKLLEEKEQTDKIKSMLANSMKKENEGKAVSTEASTALAMMTDLSVANTAEDALLDRVESEDEEEEEEDDDEDEEEEEIDYSNFNGQLIPTEPRPITQHIDDEDEDDEEDDDDDDEEDDDEVETVEPSLPVNAVPKIEKVTETSSNIAPVIPSIPPIPPIAPTMPVKREELQSVVTQDDAKAEEERLLRLISKSDTEEEEEEEDEDD